MSSWESFDVTFSFNKDFAHEKRTIDAIHSHRRLLGNQLFIDRLLGLMGLKAGMGVAVLVVLSTNGQQLRNNTLPKQTNSCATCTNRYCRPLFPIIRNKL